MNIHKSQLWLGVNKRYQGFDPSPTVKHVFGNFWPRILASGAENEAVAGIRRVRTLVVRMLVAVGVFFITSKAWKWHAGPTNARSKAANTAASMTWKRFNQSHRERLKERGLGEFLPQMLGLTSSFKAGSLKTWGQDCVEGSCSGLESAFLTKDLDYSARPFSSSVWRIPFSRTTRAPKHARGRWAVWDPNGSRFSMLSGLIFWIIFIHS